MIWVALGLSIVSLVGALVTLAYVLDVPSKIRKRSRETKYHWYKVHAQWSYVEGLPISLCSNTFASVKHVSVEDHKVTQDIARLFGIRNRTVYIYAKVSDEALLDVSIYKVV